MDMSSVIIPKSDQWNADDFIAGPLTFTIRDVKITPGSEQPVNIVLEGTNKFYRPCKSMSRVLVGAWGADAKAYIGRSLTLYRDPAVKWGGMEVGGIRISHMSDIDGAKTMVLTATKGSRKPHKVLPLVMQPQQTQDAAANWANAFIARMPTFDTLDALLGFEAEKAAKLAELQAARPELHQRVIAAIDERKAQLAPAATPSAESAVAQSGFDDDDLTAGPAHMPPAQPATLLDEVDQQQPTSGEDPAAARANTIIDELKAAASVAEVTATWGRNAGHLAAMDDALKSSLIATKEARLSELKAKELAE